jgi:hypothetical protein
MMGYDMCDLSGRVALVTGGTGSLGHGGVSERHLIAVI